MQSKRKSSIILYMNPKAQKLFDKIVAKDLNTITPQDIVFLKARRDYLTDEQHMKFLDVLGEKGIGKPEEGKKVDKLARYHELIKTLKAKGITINKGTKLADLEKMVLE
jgi:hypothetical protein